MRPPMGPGWTLLRHIENCVGAVNRKKVDVKAPINCGVLRAP